MAHYARQDPGPDQDAPNETELRRAVLMQTGGHIVPSLLAALEVVGTFRVARAFDAEGQFMHSAPEQLTLR
jgi:hypothetical protein